MSDTKYLSSFSFTLGGSPAPAEMIADLIEVTIENSLHLPDVATLVLRDRDSKWIDDSRLEPGAEIKVKAVVGNKTKEIFDGEIVEIEPVFSRSSHLVTIRAFDRLHRLSRGRYARSFVNVKDGDVIQKIAQEVGLRASVGPTTIVREHLMQSGQTNLEFLQGRAAALGYLLYVEGTALHCKAPGSTGAAIDLKMPDDFHDFRPRLTTISQVSKVQARGWDPKQKREVLGEAQNGATHPKVGVNKSGGQLAQSAFRISAEYLVADRPVRTQAEADKLAQAVADQFDGKFIEAEGVAQGNPNIVAGASVKISGVGQRFSGTYFVTSSRHAYTPDEGYLTSFFVSGLHPSTLIGLLAPDQPAAPAPHLAVGVVTDNNDPENMGRVKVKYPWLTNDHASGWARVVSAGAGPDRGFMVLPEVNDEVLVGFEMGDINQPYVLGGLWNGKDKPPRTSNVAVKGGKVVQRVLRSRAGHEILIDDDDSKGGITIKDKNGNQIVLTIDQDKLTITSKGDMTFDTQGNLTLKTAKKLVIEATQAGEIKAMGLKLDGKTSATEVKGMSVKVDGGAGTVDVKGSMINLN